MHSTNVKSVIFSFSHAELMFQLSEEEMDREELRMKKTRNFELKASEYQFHQHLNILTECRLDTNLTEGVI